MIYTESFPIKFKPVANPDAIVTASNARFTVLTSRLIRMEYSPTETFEDRPSQAFWYREQPRPEMQVRRTAAEVQIETEHLLLSYAPGEAGFTPETLTIRLKANDVTWHYGDADPGNLRGTTRTLDQMDGPLDLEPGLMSRTGWALADDTQGLAFDAKGWIAPREAPVGYQDLYFFGYGRDYVACLQDYTRITGPVPLLPRWVLGNWWSRYWAYTSDELLALMREFQAHQVPLSTCIVDMDWHITDTGNRSSGWTGYTWNRELFPDPQAFLQALHQMGLKTALNLHPALGVYPHEEQYEEMARRMGMDPASQEPVPFAIADPEFARAYFEVLHHPQEEMGVDFWWIDWQQGTLSKLAGLDPLWWLNHLHFFDRGRDGKKRSFVFSRWGGLGNHRYPIGFSGDTVVSWDSLAFQPYFTATAANVNFGWWSHDIGGHMGGIEEAELYTRWVQFGVFSPILRLHSTKNAYHERCPWGYDAETLRVTREAMQLRHALIPYLYTMSWRNHTTSLPPVTPMYYDYPDDERAYHCPNQYNFGTELIAAPFVTPADPETHMSRQVVWLPPGRWFDFFDGLSYPGDGWHAVHGTLQDIPVFAKAGAILPLGPKTGWDGVGNPEHLDVHIFPGADNRFELYEDDGLETYSLLPLVQTWEPQRLRFEIGPAKGDTGHLPAQRSYTLLLRGVANGSVSVSKDGEEYPVTTTYDAQSTTLTLSDIILAPTEALSVVLTTESDTLVAAPDYRLPACRRLIRVARLNTNTKSMLAARLDDLLAHPPALRDFEMQLGERVAQAIVEILLGAGAHKAYHPADRSERVILWNNHESPYVSFKFVGVPAVGWASSRRAGALPRFAAFEHREDRLSIRMGEGDGRVSSAVEWLQQLPEHFRPESARDLDVVLQINLRGEEAQEAMVRISGGTLRVVPGSHPNPELTIDADATDWLRLINGEADPTEMFLAGQVQISGDMDLIMRLADVLGGAGDQTQYNAARWKLSVNYLDMVRLELGHPG
jgi:putative sterol carrier protein